MSSFRKITSVSKPTRKVTSSFSFASLDVRNELQKVGKGSVEEERVREGT